MYVYDPPPDPKIEFNRQALHAFQLGFKHPVDRRPLKFEAPLPADFVALLERLRKPAPGKPTTGIQQASGKSREKSN
jgi:hypothetical protein